MKQQSSTCCVCVAPADIWQPAEASSRAPLKSRIPGVWFITSAHEPDFMETEHPCAPTHGKAAFPMMSEKVSWKTQWENKDPEETVLAVLMCWHSCYMPAPNTAGTGCWILLVWPLIPWLKLSLCEKLFGSRKISKMAHRAMFEGSVKRICNPVASCSVSAHSHSQPSQHQWFGSCLNSCAVQTVGNLTFRLLINNLRKSQPPVLRASTGSPGSPTLPACLPVPLFDVTLKRLHLQQLVQELPCHRCRGQEVVKTAQWITRTPPLNAMPWRPPPTLPIDSWPLWPPAGASGASRLGHLFLQACFPVHCLKENQSCDLKILLQHQPSSTLCSHFSLSPFQFTLAGELYLQTNALGKLQNSFLHPLSWVRIVCDVLIKDDVASSQTGGPWLKNYFKTF